MMPDNAQSILRIMELRQLKYFVAVAEVLHFRHAAEIVHVAQPALSQQIRQLEQEIGAKLFERSHHKVQLTPAGKAFHSRAQSILKAVKQAVTDTLAVDHGEAGTVVIGFVSTAAVSVLPKVMAKIREDMPRAEVELKELATGEQIDGLYRSTIDIGFFHAKLENPALESVVVARDRLVVAMPKKNRFATRPRVNLKDLVDETVIIPARHARAGYFERVLAAYQDAGILPERVHHTGLVQSGLLLVGAGIGVSLVPECFTRIRIGGVVYRRLTSEPVPIDLLAAWRRDNASPVLARMIAELKTFLRA